jgi:hypothetical protein
MAKTVEKFRVRAGKDAPDFVAHGNLHAEKKNGFYETDNARFAGHLEQLFGSSAAAPETAKPKAKRKPAKVAKTAAAAEETTAEAPADNTETTGGNE